MVAYPKSVTQALRQPIYKLNGNENTKPKETCNFLPPGIP